VFNFISGFLEIVRFMLFITKCVKSSLAFLNKEVITGRRHNNSLRSAYRIVPLFYMAAIDCHFFFSVGLPVANAPDVPQPCGLLYYP
jgi:hypothetical protein